MREGRSAGSVVLRSVVPLAAAVLVAACVTVKGGKAGVKDDKASEALRTFAKAVESLDVGRVLDFYAPDAYSRVLDRAPRNTTGAMSLRDDVAATLAPIASLHAEPVGEIRAWKDGDRAWTIQDFHVTGTLKDGRGFAVDVRYSAVWRKADKKDRQEKERQNASQGASGQEPKWLVEYEHLMGPPPVARMTAAPAPAK